MIATEARTADSDGGGHDCGTDRSLQARSPTSPSTDRPSPRQQPTQHPQPGAQDDNGIGDELFPSLGNPGIDVEHYTLALDYDPQRHQISATAHLDLVMTEDRATISLDSDGPDRVGRRRRWHARPRSLPRNRSC